MLKIGERPDQCPVRQEISKIYQWNLKRSVLLQPFRRVRHRQLLLADVIIIRCLANGLDHSAIFVGNDAVIDIAAAAGVPSGVERHVVVSEVVLEVVFDGQEE